jgi:hypothetical protein
MAYFKVLLMHVSGGSENNHENHQNILSVGRNSKPKTQEYETEAMATEQHYSANIFDKSGYFSSIHLRDTIRGLSDSKSDTLPYI